MLIMRTIIIMILAIMTIQYDDTPAAFRQTNVPVHM